MAKSLAASRLSYPLLLPLPLQTPAFADSGRVASNPESVLAVTVPEPAGLLLFLIGLLALLYFVSKRPKR